MAGHLGRTVVRRVVVVRSERRLELTPSLVDVDHADDIRSDCSGVGGGAEGAGSAESGAERTESAKVGDAGLIVSSLILNRDRRTDAVAELPGVGELVDASNGTAATDEAVEVVARIVLPGRAELRDRLTNREAGELDEGGVDAHRTTFDHTRAGVVRGRTERARANRRVNGRSRPIAGVSIVTPSERQIGERADDAVFGRRAGVDGGLYTRPPGVGIREAVLRAATRR